ncbi:MAG: hypothetical protein QTN59_05255 [Candidatus Electrothrix communis]|nr:MAG: hypothetical protein QTN59_05255 [Candidatus Electrothrix communis]
MATQYQVSPDKVRGNNHNRLHSSLKIYEFEEARGRQSQRQFAQKEKIPRTTLQYWLKRKDNIDASPALRHWALTVTTFKTCFNIKMLQSAL